MSSWQRLDQIEELVHITTAQPPPLPETATIDWTIYPHATRWQRFFARIVDIWWQAILIGAALGYGLALFSADFVSWMSKPGSAQLFGLVCLPISLVLDAAIYRVFGNTPGKVLLGLKVIGSNGSSLGFGKYLERNFSLWLYGFAFGLPFISVLTLIHQASRLGRGLPARHDQNLDCQVRAKPIGWLRLGMFVLFLVFVVLVWFAFRIVEGRMDGARAAMVYAPAYTWTNPVTRQSVQIDPRWKSGAQTQSDGSSLYLFRLGSGEATVALMVETIPDITLATYVEGLREINFATLRLKDEESLFEVSGYESWMAEGSSVGNPDSRVELQVIRIDDDYWRIITVQQPPIANSSRQVGQLKGKLWTSVLNPRRRT
jgi:hypothetical protein